VVGQQPGQADQGRAACPHVVLELHARSLRYPSRRDGGGPALTSATDVRRECQPVPVTSTHADRRAAEAETASSTRCTPSASSNDGCGSAPVAIASTRSRTSWVNVCSYPTMCPGGHHADMYGCPGSVTRIRRKPCSSTGSVASWNSSSFRRSMSKAADP